MDGDSISIAMKTVDTLTALMSAINPASISVGAVTLSTITMVTTATTTATMDTVTTSAITGAPSTATSAPSPGLDVLRLAPDPLSSELVSRGAGRYGMRQRAASLSFWLPGTPHQQGDGSHLGVRATRLPCMSEHEDWDSYVFGPRGPDEGPVMEEGPGHRRDQHLLAVLEQGAPDSPESKPGVSSRAPSRAGGK
ncbi:C-Type Lectin Domain Family 4 Member K [Manis pentadactyla]|nr:C-Type Lectin Domain Family 4 Member K [Manis pentadactyla]